MRAQRDRETAKSGIDVRTSVGRKKDELRYGWKNCPADVRGQVHEVVDCVRENLKRNLAAIYLHGSIAMGCFNPRAGDIDLLVISRGPIALSAKRAVVKSLLRVSSRPVPVEATFVSRGQLRRWQYPTPFEIHFSESWREKYTTNLNRALAYPAKPRDTDLAIQIPTARQRGKCLYGRAAARVLPNVPDSDQIASVVQDFYWARKRISKIPSYFVLNSCRIYAFLLTRRIYSKDEGCAWAMRRVPQECRAVVRNARAVYRRGESKLLVSAPELRTYARWITKEIRSATCIGNVQS
jgi:predicted nucleotidyltransferase